jgi:hypothetical protein
MRASLLLRTTALTGVVVATFFGCGGKEEAEYPAVCGDGVIERAKGEECEPGVPITETCSGLTMGAKPFGEITCAADCTLNEFNCSSTMEGTGGTGTGGNTGTGGSTGTGGRFTGTGGRFTGTGGRNNGTGGTGLGTGGGLGAGGGLGGGTTVDVQCTTNKDCRTGQACCGLRSGGQYTSFQCQASCGTADTATECGQPSDCGSGQQCCAVSGGGTAYASLSCQAACDANTSRVVCVTNADCPQGTTCRTTQRLPSDFKVCR